MDDRDRDLAEATSELSETLEAIRSELRAPPRGPLGFPRPPRPAELLRFTEQYTIPTVIAMLETSIKSLELLAGALRVADGRGLEGSSAGFKLGSGKESLSKVGSVGRDQFARTSRKTLQRLDDALAELQSAAAGEPSNPELQQLLQEARELRADVDDRLQEAEQESKAGDDEEAVGIQVGSVSEREEGATIDVDEELASIKDELDDEHSKETNNGDEAAEESDE